MKLPGGKTGESLSSDRAGSAQKEFSKAAVAEHVCYLSPSACPH